MPTSLTHSCWSSTRILFIFKLVRSFSGNRKPTERSVTEKYVLGLIFQVGVYFVRERYKAKLQIWHLWECRCRLTNLHQNRNPKDAWEQNARNHEYEREKSLDNYFEGLIFFSCKVQLAGGGGGWYRDSGSAWILYSYVSESVNGNVSLYYIKDYLLIILLPNQLFSLNNLRMQEWSWFGKGNQLLSASSL